MTNKPRGVLYAGATCDLRTRVKDHKRGRGSWFTAKYNCDKLVWCEALPDMAAARKRELQIKAWQRIWKLELVERANPQWLDLPVVEGARLRGFA